MKLQVKRVRFGDCAVLEGRRARLIVDCGSDNQSLGKDLSAQDFAYSAIAAQVNDHIPTDILISHLHTDHYRGFLNLGKDVPPLFAQAPPVGTAWAAAAPVGSSGTSQGIWARVSPSTYSGA